jgi:hypothetical protein
MKKIFTLFAVAMTALCLNAAEVTVADGVSTNANIPLYGAYVDEYIHTQIIYPADSLTALAGKSLTGMTFYLSSPAEASWGDARFQIGFAEVEESGFGTSSVIASFHSATITPVYSGELDGTQTAMVISFSAPFVYGGGNLLFDLQSTAKGTYKSATFLGDFDIDRPYIAITGNSASSAAAVTPNSSRNSRFMPKTTFVYNESAAICDMPEVPVASEISAHAATLSWESDNDSFQFVCVRKGETPDWTDVEPQAVKSVTIDTLKAHTDYEFCLRAYCSEDSQSGIRKVSFTTDYSCFAPASVAISDTTAYGAVVTWTASGKGETQYQYICVPADAEPNWEDAQLVETLSVELEGLQPVTNYDVYVRSYCGAEEQSLAVKASFRTFCGVLSALPWSEDFSSADALACWDLESADIRIFSGALMFGFNGAGNLVAALPEFDAAYDTLAVSFRYNTADYKAQLELGYISEEDVFVALGEPYAKTKEYTFVEETPLTEVPASAQRLAFRYVAEEASYVYVDNITLVVVPGETTAIDNTTAAVKAVKRFENGQLVIIKNGVKFNALGSVIE